MSTQKAAYSKPEWLRKKITLSSLREVEAIIAKGKLHTVCQEAMCPNIGECFSRKQATFLILGKECTRHCTFCNVSKEMPLPPDPDEPLHVAESVEAMGLRHVVITSPTRDDLSDGGAEHFAKVVRAIKTYDETIIVELLIPDLQENEAALQIIAQSGAQIIGHNLETVPRLYHIRKGAKYERSLRVLKKLAQLNPDIRTKSGIMLGLGEKEEEVNALLQDLLDHNCRLLSIGQYLSPSNEHTKVVEFVPPERFDHFHDVGMAMGFDFIKSSPYTRSSYMADEYLKS
ncbi:lipoyl synthase [Sulfurovum sp. NBC37-1]|uniref:lipoyl synthase n=1 Tax=Sulfurovum sp. (strain NBC37-1) TaxID=387093 RepID=UPI0001587729|nr:lipoyl synthase [Sulfurovum sp. NBC37-1]BAF71922.1 lipoate synthase [Sulfurovum sp. NBC37-1]